MDKSKNFDKNEVDIIVKELEQFGLDEHSAMVYIALLRLGETGTSPIIRETGLHGQYVYKSLERLEAEGLVQHVIKRGRRKYSSKSPRTLVHLAKARKANAEVLASKLDELMVLPPEQAFEVYQGRESYIAHEFDMLERAEEGSELLIIGGSGDKFNSIIGSRLGEYANLQSKKNIKIKYIGSESEREKTSSLHGGRKNFSIKYLPGLFTGQVNTNIWPDAIGFNIYGEPVTRFTIFSSIVAGSQKQFFEALWKIAKD